MKNKLTVSKRIIANKFGLVRPIYTLGFPRESKTELLCRVLVEHDKSSGLQDLVDKFLCLGFPLKNPVGRSKYKDGANGVVIDLRHV